MSGAGKSALEGIEDLSDEKLEIVKFLRDYYHKLEAFPILNYACRNTKQPRGCVNEEFIYPMKAWKIVGLPKPDGIHFVTVDSGEHFIMEECCCPAVFDRDSKRSKQESLEPL